MHRWKNIIFNITFSLNILLLFLLIFDNRLKVPAWLQVVGRMHTLFLHFPIVMLALCIFWELFSGYKKSYAGVKAEIGNELLLAAAFTSVITALMGLFLSREAGYTPDLLVWHKWGGVLISFLSLTWYVFRVQVRQMRPALLTTSFGLMVMIILTGHLGADITHGDDFLFAPVTAEKQKPPVLFEDAIIYTDMVQPILAAKCITCHNSGKAKGDLVMETKEQILKGGKDGKLWDSTQNDFGLMMQRIHLPLQARKHMAPQGKPQLTEQEIAILYRWIRGGANFTAKVSSLPEHDSLRLLATPLFQTIETDDYTFKPADENKVRSLNNNYRVVKPLATGSPALGVEFFGAAQFKKEQLKDLLAVKEQVVSLNLDKMPVTDDDLATIAQFFNLRKLNLSFTNITGTTIGELGKLKELKLLSLSGAKIKPGSMLLLKGVSKLSQLFVWNTSIPPGEINKLQQQLKTTTIETGFKGDTVVVKLNPPIIENEEQVITSPVPLQLKHYVKDVAVHYTTDGSEPDSIHAPIYQGDVMLDKKETVKAKAFKTGWLSSDMVEKTFYKAGFEPDSVQLINPPDPQYKGDGALTLYDRKIGSLNFRDGKWLGYRVQPMEAIFYFGKGINASSVTISSMVDINSYLMPPQEIELWGGDNLQSLHLLKRMQPQQPQKPEQSKKIPQPKKDQQVPQPQDKPPYSAGYDIPFPPLNAKILKVILRPVPKLPPWHRGKGDKGWIFTDEIFWN